jgi:phosphopentomutase
MVTADHGCDPTFPGTDHTREYIPLLICGKHVKYGVNLGVRKQFSDIGATIYEYLTGESWREGKSFLKDIWED